MIKISIEAKTVKELFGAVNSLWHELSPYGRSPEMEKLGQKEVKLSPTVIADEIKETEEEISEEPEEQDPPRKGGFPDKKKPGRKPKNSGIHFKNDKVAPSVQEESLEEIDDVLSETKEEPLTASVPTKEQVHEALQKFANAKGLPEARLLIAKFKVTRISELKEDQYAEFVKACTLIKK